MEENRGCSLGGCLGTVVILLVIFLFLRGCVSTVTGWFSSEYRRPDAFQYTLKRYRNRSLDLRFKLPDDMTFTNPDNDFDMEELTGVHEEMIASGGTTYTTVFAYELDKATSFLQVFGLRGAGDTPSVGTQTTEEEMLSYLLDSVAQSIGGGDLWNTGETKRVKFAGKKYTSATWRIGMESEYGGVTYFYMRGYVRRSGDLMTCVLITSYGLSEEDAQDGLEHVADCYRKG